MEFAGRSSGSHRWHRRIGRSNGPGIGRGRSLRSGVGTRPRPGAQAGSSDRGRRRQGRFRRLRRHGTKRRSRPPMKRSSRRWAPVNVLLNAAGGNQPQVTLNDDLDFAAIATDDWQRCFDLNLGAGALLPCQEFGSAMAARGRGSIINIASIAAHLPVSRVVAYSAAKAAVLNLTQFLAREWADKGVRVNSITPGFFPAEQKPPLALSRRRHPNRTRPTNPLPHAHGPLWPPRGASRRCGVPRIGRGQRLRHRRGHPR